MSISTLAIVALAAPASRAATGPAFPVTLQVASTSNCSDTAPRAIMAIYCTLAGATAAAQPGDSIVVAQLGSSDQVAGSGQPGQPITIYSTPDQQGTWNTDLTISGQHDVVLKDMRLTSLSVTGSSSVTVNHVLARRLANSATPTVGIHLSGTTNSTITDSRVDNDLFGNAGDVALLVDNGSNGVTVSNTIIARTQGAGLEVRDSQNAVIVSDTVGDNGGDGIALTGTSTGAVLENDISSGNGTAQIDVEASATAQTRVSHNLVNGNGPISWAGTARSAKDFDAAGLGTADLQADPRFDLTDSDPDWATITPAWPSPLTNYNLQWNSPAIDAADSGATGEPQNDSLGHARVDDPDVADTGTGTITYADLGAREFLGVSSVLTVTPTFGVTPQDYLTATFKTSGVLPWSPAVSVSYDYGDGSPKSSSSTHTYPAAGNFAGTATFTGAGGETKVVSFSVSPRATVITPFVDSYSGSSWREWRFHVYGGPVGTAYDIDFGDGQHQTLTGEGTVTHEYPAAGTYPLSVKAAYNGWTGTLSFAFTLNAPLPVAVGYEQPTVQRIWGNDRYQTAIAASQRFSSGSATAVVLARGDDFPDALAGGPLAAHLGGSLLLTDPATLTPATASEISRVLGADGSKTVYILGGTSAVSPAVEQAVRALGYQVVRYGGSDRFATALQIAQNGVGDKSTVIVARGDDFPDALAAGPLAANRGAVLVLSDGNQLDASTAAFVQAHQSVIAIGGPARDAVTSQINLTGKAFQAAAGVDRYDTAAQTASLFGGSTRTLIGLATGQNFPDALSGGAVMAAAGQPLLLTDPTFLPSGAANLLAGSAGVKIDVFGGVFAVPDAIVGQVAAIVHEPVS